MHAGQLSPTADAAPARLRVRVVDSDAELAGLAQRWEALQRDAEPASVFGSFDWQHTWWRVYGRSGGQKLRLLLALDGETLVGILPLYLERARMLRLPVRLLRFVGTGGDTFPDDLGPVLARGREAEVARALAEAVIALRGWDVLSLTDMDPACAFTRAIEAVARTSYLHCQAGRSERIAFVALPRTYEAWLGSLHRDRRYRIKNIRKKLYAAHPSARFFVWSDPATLDRGVDRLVHLHRKRWEAAGQSHSFSSDEYVAFHRAVMAACLERDRLRLYCLEIDGEIVAMFYFYRFRDRVFLMQSGFDPDYSDVKPGQVLLGHIVEHAISEGHTVLDFLRGDHRYKDELASGERETVFLTALKPRLGSLVYLLRRNYLPVVKRRLLQALHSKS